MAGRCTLDDRASCALGTWSSPSPSPSRRARRSRASSHREEKRSSSSTPTCRCTFIWGSEVPACEDAVFGLGNSSNGGDIECNVGGIGGPHPAGTGKRDRLVLPGGTLVDINGNVGEWAGDLFNTWSESCWSRAGIYRDPSCEVVSPSLGRAHAARSGGWVAQPASLMATSRSAYPTNLPVVAIDLGLRCARYGL